ncbi:hypothetical protein SAMN05421741_11325 [Paenimyroides ummariense]|uniref:Uncharacterized protein n=1 Tax=Paenimyroides ummariense TaxID=913024 RepID=A0A1I5CQS9_9FLAO|nr:hypothetical protein [Paenimyroides ummariense]SFN89375.1 hypothetical protein SAMN05421741_11325 [Paenimyroides ummariense]
MQKVPLTQEGVELKRRELEALPEAEFRNQLKEIQFNFREWGLENFKLNEDQVAYFKEMPQEIVDQQGLGIAIGFDYKLEIRLTTPETYNAPLASKRRTKVIAEGSGTWTPGEPVHVNKYYIGVSYTIPF